MTTMDLSVALFSLMPTMTSKEQVILWLGKISSIKSLISGWFFFLFGGEGSLLQILVRSALSLSLLSLSRLFCHHLHVFDPLLSVLGNNV